MTTVTLITCPSGYDAYLMDETFNAWRDEDIEHQGLENGDIFFEVDSKFVSQEKCAEGKAFFVVQAGAVLKNIKEVGVDITK